MTEDMRYHFVGNPESEDNLEELRSLSWEEGTLACLKHAWIWPLYCQLKMRGKFVSFSYSLERDAINFVHGQVARFLLKPRDFMMYFVIGIRADFRRFPFGQVEIVQNQHGAGGRRIYMPHFPQPGLRPRDANRQHVENICYSGQANNFFDSASLDEDLKQIGCRYVFKGQGEWQQMQEVDVLLGIRSFNKAKHHSKPPTKMFNAWLAGIPFVGGCDSAYEQVGIPGRNYLRVSSYTELLSALVKLKTDYALYRSLVEEGREAARQYTEEKITDRWIRFLDDVVSPEYYRWKSGKKRHRLRGTIQSCSFLVREKYFREPIEFVKNSIR